MEIISVIKKISNIIERKDCEILSIFSSCLVKFVKFFEKTLEEYLIFIQEECPENKQRREINETMGE